MEPGVLDVEASHEDRIMILEVSCFDPRPLQNIRNAVRREASPEGLGPKRAENSKHKPTLDGDRAAEPAGTGALMTKARVLLDQISVKDISIPIERSVTMNAHLILQQYNCERIWANSLHQTQETTCRQISRPKRLVDFASASRDRIA